MALTSRLLGRCVTKSTGGTIESLICAALACVLFVGFAPKSRAQGGVPQWTNRYSGGIGNDYVTAVAVDDCGNVFVTGNSSGSGSGFDYATVAYSTLGVPLWTNRYNGPGNNVDVPKAIAVGGGKVFVTGTSWGGADYDYATVAYSTSGTVLWVRRYNGPGNGDDGATAISVDANANVFVTGYSVNPGTGYDYATVAYSSVGVPLWTNRYDGPGNGNDYATAVAAGSGNVFVTGYSTNNNSGYDYATVAYSSTGVALWTNRYNGPSNKEDSANAIAVGGNGDVFVTGRSLVTGANYDYATVAYTSTGVGLWTNRYNGPGNGDDQALAIAVGAGNTVYVTGQSVGVGSQYDFATVAYSGTGAPLWTNRFNGPGNGNDGASAVAVGNDGNIFVTGASDRGGNNYDFATLAYSAAGAPLWTNRYNGPGNNDDEAVAIAVDAGGDVIVAGPSWGIGTYGYAVVEYSAGPGLRIIPIFDQSIIEDPDSATIEATINAAISVYRMNFSDRISVCIRFIKDTTISLAQSSTSPPLTVAYPDYRAALVSHATTPDDATAVANLPVVLNNPVNQNPNVRLLVPLARALGFITDPQNGRPDGTNWLNTTKMNLSAAVNDPTKFSLFSAASHEIDEVLGIDSALFGQYDGNPSPTGPVAAEDLFRYSADGERSFKPDVVVDAYFSLDGINLLARFNQYCVDQDHCGDFNDWFSRDGGQTPQVQDAYQTPGATPVLGVELRVLDALGFTRVLPKPPPKLSLIRQGANIIISWTETGFVLQSALVITGPFIGIPNATSPYTNSMTETQQYFRLINN
jgi:hypothetical protein